MIFATASRIFQIFGIIDHMGRDFGKFFLAVLTAIICAIFSSLYPLDAFSRS
jgi:tetrahydromethanopterin S-methyltransferase subunit G